MREMSISHKLHPARQGHSLSTMTELNVKWCLAKNKSLAIGTVNVDAMYDKLKFAFPDAKLSKHQGYVLVEKD